MNARFRQVSSFPPLSYVYLCAFISSLQSSPQARVTQPRPHPLPAAGVEHRVRLQRRRRTLLLLLRAHNARHSARNIKRRQPWPCCDCWCRSKRANLQYCVQVCPGVLHVEERRHVHGVAAFHEHAVRTPSLGRSAQSNRQTIACYSRLKHCRYIGCADGFVVPLR
jgi:hypothetical protein